jgi:hydrogenase-4 component E
MGGSGLIETVLVLLLVSNLLLLGSSSLPTCIRMVGLQGLVVGLLAPAMHSTGGLWRALALAVGSMILKGIVFPSLLLRILRQTGIRREVEPFVGYSLSILVGVAALAFSFWIDARLALPAHAVPGAALILPTGLATLLIGLFLIVSRRKAVSQVLGYIVVENGVFICGLELAGQVPMLVELGVLLDLFVAVFIMGIAACHISREFDHMDVDQLDQLRG